MSPPLSSRRPGENVLRRGEVIGFAGRLPAAITATDWHEMVRGTLQGFLTLRLRSGMVLRKCSHHRQGDKRWIGLPGKPQLDQKGRHRIDPGTGKKLYLPVVEIPSREQRDLFQRLALAAVDRFLEGDR
jgi:hypothetical protein